MAVKFKDNGSVVVPIGGVIEFSQELNAIISDEDKHISQGFIDNGAQFRIEKDNIRANDFIEY